MPDLTSTRTRKDRLPLQISSSHPSNITTTTISASRTPHPGAMTSPISPITTLNILPSNQAAVISSPTSAPIQTIPVSGTANGRPMLSARASSQSLHHDANGAGPIRHPRPMTAAQLHSELEQENEAVVNRLTRELSLLRAAQNASVVSNASSTSTHAEPLSDHHHPLASPVYPIPITTTAATRRHARTASNTSIRSTAAATISSSYEARRGIPLSRQGSSASRRSRTDSPGPHGFTAAPTDHTLGYLQQQRIPAPTSVPLMAAAGSLPDATSPSLIAATPRYEETAFYRAELESAKRENDVLKRRIRELERLVRDRRPSDSTSAPTIARPRSESVSTTASINPTVGSGAGIVPPREPISGISVAHQVAHAQGQVQTGLGLTLTSGINTQPPTPSRPHAERAVSVTGSIAVGVSEEEVKVGESAANSGMSAVASSTGVGPMKE